MKKTGTVIVSKKNVPLFPDILGALLPYRLTDEIRHLGAGIGRIEEIRLRCGKCASLTASGKNIILDTVLSREDMDSLLSRLCEDSLYAFNSTISAGYITLDGGIRVGICGRAAVENQKIIGIYDVSAMNIRIPSDIRNVGEPVCRLLDSFSMTGGVLVYAPPGVGKTTLLRGVAAKMAGGAHPYRVAVIDTRGELSFALSGKNLCIDVLSGYPRAVGIEIASRTMNAQLMICDEIGDIREAEAIIAAQNCGVPFVASAHAGSLDSLLRRTGIRLLHRARVFRAYVGIERRAGCVDYKYNISDWEEADAVLQNSGGTDTGSQRIRGSIYAEQRGVGSSQTG